MVEPRRSQRKTRTPPKLPASAEPGLIAEATTVIAKKHEKATKGSVRSARKVKVEASKKKVEVELPETKVERAEVKEKENQTSKSKKGAAKRKLKGREEEEAEHECGSAAVEEAKPAAKKRKTKEEEAMPLARRTAVSSLRRAMYIGAHVSAAGGVQNSVQNAANIGANAFALFLKNQKTWKTPPLADDARDEFYVRMEEQAYDGAHVVPHGSYLVNLAQAEKEKADQAYGNFLDDLKRCDTLGIKLYNFHPGSTGGASMAEATARIAAQLNKAHRATKSVITLIENMCGHGKIVGGPWEDLRDIIERVEDKSRVGVCLDTCHAFGAGHDLRTPEAFGKTMAEFDRIIGLKYLKALHLNDSKAPFASHRDVHANIGTGFLGLQAFHNVMNFEPFQNLPMVLETPIDEKGSDGKTFENKQIWADEIKLLEGLIGADMESEGWVAKAKELQARGAPERKRLQDQVDKKAAEDAKKADKAAKGSKKMTEFFGKKDRS